MGHLVHRQILELQFADEATARRWSPQLSGLNQRSVLPELERAFSQLVDDRHSLQIERLELDLGRISQDFLEAELSDKLRQQLGAALQPHLPAMTEGARAGSEEQKNQRVEDEPDESLSAAALLELFELFLQKGRLPWWVDKQRAERLDSLYQHFWQVAPQQARRLMLATLVGPLQRRRFTEQFGPQSHQLTLRQLLPAELASLLSDLRKLAAVLLYRQLGAAQAARSGSYDLVYQLLSKTELSAADRPIDLVRQLFVDLADWSGQPYAQLLAAIDPEVGRSGLAPASLNLLAQLLREGPRSAAVLDRSERTRHSSGQADSTDEEDVEPVTAKPAAGLEVALDNAGLVLLWPYLPELFGKLDLLETGTDRQPRPKPAAVLLLQQLVTGQPAAPEPQLALNKLLCGVSQQLPVARRLRRSKVWDAEIEALLTAVIRHWAVLKDTSVFGLRSSFLQRDGLLLETEQGWLLRVDRKVYDLLLDQLPWGLGMIKLSWMEKPLRVEW
ncbi:MAG TPA: contractile injection system tape measure protein [Malonomonas sp.]